MQKFLVPGVVIRKVSVIPELTESFYTGEDFRVYRNEFSMHVSGVGDFYARDGKEVQIAPAHGADPKWISVYLNGQVLAAILHQRRIINFHASSFILRKRGIMVLGGTGSGKSSLTAAFVLNGAGFLSDDFTPVIFREGKPFIWPIYKKIKIRGNTIDQLGISGKSVRKAERGTGKYFLDVSEAPYDDFPLHFILKIESGDVSSPGFFVPEPSEKFSLLRSEICSWEMLKGMPETEKNYLGQLINIISNAEIVRIIRPSGIRIPDFYSTVCDYLNKDATTI